MVTSFPRVIFSPQSVYFKSTESGLNLANDVEDKPASSFKGVVFTLEYHLTDVIGVFIFKLMVMCAEWVSLNLNDP